MESDNAEAEDLLTITRDVALALAAAHDLRAGTRQLAALCLQMRCVDGVGVYLVDHEAAEVRLLAHAGLSEAFVARATHYGFDTPQAEIVLGGRPTYARYPEVLSASDAAKTAHELSGLGVVPIQHGARVVGCLNVGTRGAEGFPPPTRVAVETMAAQIGAAMARLVAEEQRALLRRELDHRVRNNLTLVQALAEQAFAQTDCIERYRTTFLGRIGAMARLHDTLAGGGWDHLEVGRMLARALSPVEGPQLTLEGPRVCLAPEAATPVGLVFHELGCNALVHGALSVREGRVHLRWSLTESELCIDWREGGGPPVPPEPEPGGGTEIARALVEHQLGGRLELAFDPAGLRARVQLPASLIEPCET
jgi:two-component sensor histidine kinase